MSFKAPRIQMLGGTTISFVSAIVPKIGEESKGGTFVPSYYSWVRVCGIGNRVRNEHNI